MSEISSKRIQSIDIMRGLTLFLMLFVNDLYVDGVPKWLIHTKANQDGMGLADWVFPGFLFMVGLSIPFAFEPRTLKGDNKLKLFFHIIVRTISLLIIGVFMVNIDDYNAELAGINKYFWVLAGYISVFLIWNRYPDSRLIYRTLKIIGILILIILAITFRSGTEQNIGYIYTSWWGILGLIGWGYFTVSITYLIIGDKLQGTTAVWIAFVVLNCLSQLKLVSFLDPLKPILGVIIDGSVPSIVLAGLVMGIVARKYKNTPNKLVMIAIGLGMFSIICGFILRNWFIISKIKATPSWGLICTGISILLFALIYYIVDIRNHSRWASTFVPAGRNSLSTYLAPDILYYIVWATTIPFFFYKQVHSPILAVSGSLAWAYIMIKFATFLSKKNIHLKL